MATVRARGTRWEVQVRRHGWPTLTKHFSRKRDADAWAAVTEADLARGQLRDHRLSEQTLLSDVLVRYRDEVTPAKKGRVAERCRLDALLRTPLARVSLDRLGSELVARWRDDRLARVSGSTVNRELNLLSVVLNTARKDWGITFENPVALIRRPKENRARRRRLSLEEEVRLMRALEPAGHEPDGTFSKGGTRNPWVRPMVILALETGMRRGELLALHWPDVALDERFARLHDSKNGEARDIPLSTRAVACLRTLLRIKGDPRVFPITAEALKQAFERAVARANIEDFHFHDLRHEATTRLATRLDNVLELSAVTGHKTLRMLARYYHPKASDLAVKLG